MDSRINTWGVLKRYAISLDDAVQYTNLHMSKSAKNNGVRIIGGDWRGRRLPVADVAGLRPTGDRCRETLFNWLQPWIVGADCADLFAGTGALGFEAASRGAASVLFIEKHPRAVAVLRASMEKLQAEQTSLKVGGVLNLIAEFAVDSLDLVFVDPPFDSNLGGLVLERIDRRGCVRRGGFVYIELPASQYLAVPAGWSEWREKQIGDVRMRLFRNQSKEDERNMSVTGSDD